MSGSPTTSGGSHPIETNIDHEYINTVTFAGNGAYVASSANEGTSVWQMRDSRRATTQGVEDSVYYVSASMAGQWTTAGSLHSAMLTYQQSAWYSTSGGVESSATSGYATSSIGTLSNATQFVTDSGYNGAVATWSPRGHHQTRTFSHNGMEVHASRGEGEDASFDANEVMTTLDSSYPSGNEPKRYDDATNPSGKNTSESLGPLIRGRSRSDVRPEHTKRMIRMTIKKAIRDSPLVLINTASGRLCDKSEQAAAFESMPAFTELVSSMAMPIDRTSIEQVVGGFYRYAMFSHTWEGNEPLFEKVTKISVYDLEESPTHKKLQMFCKIVREAGLYWAWSDTCCINKGNHFELHEALVSMFKWYEGSVLTLIFLRGVRRLAQRGALMRSIWNTRGWTLQEYHASKVVRFYTEDWTPYLGLNTYNHKHAPQIVSEMEEATGISAQTLISLRPGLHAIREKLCLASTRQTTRVEDAAYSLLGIFAISLPIIYGEGDKALGRFLAQLLTDSGDTSILAWRGRPGCFNSCLPASITVFSQPLTCHVPKADAEMEAAADISDTTSLDLTLAMALFDLVDGLPVPSFSGRRMRLPCLTFKLGRVSPSQNGSERVFRAQTAVLGVVEIKTIEDLSQLGSLYLVHPWINFLLDRQPVGNAEEAAPGVHHPPVSGESSSLRPTSYISISTDMESLQPPSTVSSTEKQTRVLRFIVRLGQPFGALLVTPTRWNADEYRRVAIDSLIKVQAKEFTSETLKRLIRDVRTALDVL